MKVSDVAMWDNALVGLLVMSLAVAPPVSLAAAQRTNGAAKIGGDVYVMVEGGIRPGVGLPVYLIPLNLARDRALITFCRKFLDDISHAVSVDPDSGEGEKWGLAKALRSVVVPVAETETGLQGHYKFGSVRPGRYALLAESENDMWWKEVTVKPGEDVTAHLNNRVAYSFSMRVIYTEAGWRGAVGGEPVSLCNRLIEAR